MDFESEPLTKDLGLLIRNNSSKQLLDLNTVKMEESFRAAGIILFRGFEVDLEGFVEFTTRFASSFLIHRNPLRRHVTADGTTQTVQSNRGGIPLHGEMHYLPRISTQLGPPDIIWFWCVTPGRSLGETLICDGVRVFEMLSSASRKLVLEKRLRYSHITPAEEWRRLAQSRQALVSMLSTIEGIDNGRFDEADRFLWDYYVHAVRKTLYSDQIAFINSILTPAYYHVAFEDGSVLPEHLMVEIAQVTESLTIPLHWRSHDVAMIDNSRLLHGRSLNDDQRLIYVRMGFARL